MMNPRFFLGGGCPIHEGILHFWRQLGSGSGCQALDKVARKENELENRGEYKLKDNQGVGHVFCLKLQTTNLFWRSSF